MHFAPTAAGAEALEVRLLQLSIADGAGRGRGARQLDANSRNEQGHAEHSATQHDDVQNKGA